MSYLPLTRRIIVRQSTTATEIPQTTVLNFGEIGINTYDGTMYIKFNNGSGDTIKQIGASGGGGGTPGSPFNSVQFNNGGTFGGSALLTYNGTDTLTFGDPTGATPNVYLKSPTLSSIAGSVSTLNISGGDVNGSTTGTPGDVNITAGADFIGTHGGGFVTITSGACGTGTSSAAGDVTVVGANSYSGTAGNVILQAGQAVNHPANAGSIQMKVGANVTGFQLLPDFTGLALGQLELGTTFDWDYTNSILSIGSTTRYAGQNAFGGSISDLPTSTAKAIIDPTSPSNNTSFGSVSVYFTSVQSGTVSVGQMISYNAGFVNPTSGVSPAILALGSTVTGGGWSGGASVGDPISQTGSGASSTILSVAPLVIGAITGTPTATGVWTDQNTGSTFTPTATPVLWNGSTGSGYVQTGAAMYTLAGPTTLSSSFDGSGGLNIYTTNTGSAGNIWMTAGAGINHGGTIYIAGGQTLSTGTPNFSTQGNVNIVGGEVDANYINAGNINLTAGHQYGTASDAPVNAGSVNITAGDAWNSTGNYGGSVTIAAGINHVTTNVANFGSVTLQTAGGYGNTTNTFVLGSSGAISVNGFTGSTGQVLTSQGPTTAPVWGPNGVGASCYWSYSAAAARTTTGVINYATAGSTSGIIYSSGTITVSATGVYMIVGTAVVGHPNTTLSGTATITLLHNGSATSYVNYWSGTNNTQEISTVTVNAIMSLTAGDTVAINFTNDSGSPQIYASDGAFTGYRIA